MEINFKFKIGDLVVNKHSNDIVASIFEIRARVYHEEQMGNTYLYQVRGISGMCMVQPHGLVTYEESELAPYEKK